MNSILIKARDNLCAIASRGFVLAGFVVLCNVVFSEAHAQIRDHKGKEFFLAFLPNPIEPLTLQLSILAETEARVLVEYPVGTPLGDSLTVRPGEVAIVNIPQSAGKLSGWPGRIFGRADENCIRVSATEEVACFMLNRNDASSDGGLAIPTDALHKNFVIMSYDVSHPSVGDAGVFAVVAPYDSTIVTITPAKNLEGGFAAGQPVTVLLRRGEGYLAESAFGFFGPDSTLAGSFVKASNPVTVINGNKCTRVPIDDPSCDHVFEIAQPIQTWGKHVLVAALGEESIRPAGAIYRILTAAPNTTVFLDGQPFATLNESQFLDTDTLQGAHVFTADNPIFVSQFMTSRVTSNSASADPGMVNMIPTGQFANSYEFAIPMNGQGRPLFEKNLLTVFVKNEDVGVFTHNGTVVPAQEFSPVQNSEFSTATIEMQQIAFHSTASSNGHSVIAWGFSNDNSYMFPAGGRLDVINPLDVQPPEISIEFREEAPNRVFGFVRDSKTGGIGARDTLLYGGDASGIRRVLLSDSVNVSLDSLDFTPGDPTGTFTLQLQDPTLPGKATVEVTDESENRSSLEVFIPACEAKITDPANRFVTFEEQISVNVRTVFATLDGDGLASFDKLDTIDVNGEKFSGADLTGTDTSFAVIVPLDTGQNIIIAKRIYRHRLHETDPSKAITACADTIFVTRASVQELACILKILRPGNGSIFSEDSVLVTAVLEVGGGVIPFQDSCTVNGQLVALSNDTIQVKLPLDFGENPITVSCTFTDSNGQKITCEASITVVRPSPPACAISIIQPQNGATIIADSVLFLATANITGGMAPFADSCLVNGQRVALRNDTIAVKLPLVVGENSIAVVCTFVDSLGQQTRCEAELSITRTNVPTCKVTILQPANGAILSGDSVFVKAQASVTGGALPYTDTTCAIIFNGDSLTVPHFPGGSFSTNIPLDADSLMIIALCTFTDASGQQAVCSDTVTVFRAEPLSCALTILSPNAGEVFFGDSARVTAVAAVSGGIHPALTRCSINGITPSISGDTLRVSVALNPGLNTITASCTFTDVNGDSVVCEQSIQVMKDAVSCGFIFITPPDSAVVCNDSLFVSAVVQITGGFQPVQKVCAINGIEISAVNDTLAATVKIEPGRNVIIASCALTDIAGQTITCTDSLTVFRDITPPDCDFQAQDGGIAGTFTDAGAGIASIKTDYLNNGTLIVERFRPGDKIVHFRIEPKNPDKSIGFNINVTDVCGNRFSCDPVYLHIAANDRQQYVIRFPIIDRYLYLTNNGLEEIRIDLNGKKFTFTSGAAPSQLEKNTFQIPYEGTVVFDVRPCLQEAGNKMVIELDGPSGSNADLLLMNIAGEVDFVLSYQEPLPAAFRLLQNYPNPFNPETYIPIEIPSGWPHPVKLQIYNTAGRLIKTVADGYLPAGSSTILWDGTDASGAQVASGVYFYRVVSGEVVQMRKLVLAR
jgi:hypothetical protein